MLVSSGSYKEARQPLFNQVKGAYTDNGFSPSSVYARVFWG